MLEDVDVSNNLIFNKEVNYYTIQNFCNFHLCIFNSISLARFILLAFSVLPFLSGCSSLISFLCASIMSFFVQLRDNPKIE